MRVPPGAGCRASVWAASAPRPLCVAARRCVCVRARCIEELRCTLDSPPDCEFTAIHGRRGRCCSRRREPACAQLHITPAQPRMRRALSPRSPFSAPPSLALVPCAPRRAAAAAPGAGRQRSAALAAMARIIVTFDVDGTLIESTGPRANHAHKAAFAAAFRSVYNTDTHIDTIAHHGGTDPLILLKARAARAAGRHTGARTQPPARPPLRPRAAPSAAAGSSPAHAAATRIAAALPEPSLLRS